MSTFNLFHLVVMSLLALSGFFVILAECLEASELTKKLVITVGESDRFTASLPDGMSNFYYFITKLIIFLLALNVI